MDEKRILIEEFKGLHPFKDSVIRDPFGNEIIDVESINKSAFERVINELKSVKETKTSSILILQGEPGSGKSHLLARIYRYAEIERFLFALYNPLIVRSGATYSSLLRSLFDSFERKHSQLKAKPINHIRGEIIRIGLRNYNIQEEPLAQFLIREIRKPKKALLPNVYYEEFKAVQPKIQGKLRKFIVEATLQYIKEKSNSTIGKKYLKAIIEGLISEEKYEILKDLVREGSLPKEDAEKLNITTGFAINEDIAFEIIQSVFILSPFPILLSIDQIEHFDTHFDTNGIINFLEDLYKLVSNTKNVLLLLSAQTAVFKKWNSFMPEHLKDRFSNVASLEGMKSEEGLEIVKARNKFFFGKLGRILDDPYFPFDKEDLLSKIREYKLKSPRKVIELANRILEGTTPQERSVKEEFEHLLQSEIYNKDDFEDALGELLITLFGGLKLLPKGKKLLIRVGNIVIGIDNSKNYYSMTKKLAGSLVKRGLNKAIFVRDEKMPIRDSTKSMELIKERHIDIRYYNVNEGRVLMAVQRLISLTESKDIELNRDEVNVFAKDLLNKFFGNKIPSDFINVLGTHEQYRVEKSLKAHSYRASKDEQLINEIVEKIKREFEEGKINVARLSHYIDKQSPLVVRIVDHLKSFPIVEIVEQENGEIFIAKKTL